MITLKLKYKTEKDNLEKILNYQKQYTNCFHFMFNRVQEGKSQTIIKHLPINNCDLMDAWFKQSCVNEAIQLNKDINVFSKKNKNKVKVIFGGKNNFKKRCEGKITAEEFKSLKLKPLYSIGTRSNKCIAGNQKFHIENDLNILFKPNTKTKIILKLVGVGNRIDLLRNLFLKQETRKFTLTYKLSQDYIFISFDETELYKDVQRQTQLLSRYIAIDMNPNYVGYSIIDWHDSKHFKVIKSGVYSLKTLNDIQNNLHVASNDPKKIALTNKRKYEVYKIVQNLVNKAIYYKCKVFAIENLIFKTKDKELGPAVNKLVNNYWCRSIFVENLIKRCNIFNIKLLTMKPEYSSFIGNFLFRNLKNKFPDMILSSIEISRRAYEYYEKYITHKNINNTKKNIVFPLIEDYKSFYIKSLEEFSNKNLDLKSWVTLYNSFKSLNLKYRVPLNEKFKDRLFSKYSYTTIYKFK